jgi:hypothetical protein
MLYLGPCTNAEIAGGTCPYPDVRAQVDVRTTPDCYCPYSTEPSLPATPGKAPNFYYNYTGYANAYREYFGACVP